MSLNKFTDATKGYDLDLGVGADEMKANQIETTNIDLVTINGQPYPQSFNSLMNSITLPNVADTGFVNMTAGFVGPKSILAGKFPVGSQIEIQLDGDIDVTASAGVVNLQFALSLAGIYNLTPPDGFTQVITYSTPFSFSSIFRLRYYITRISETQITTHGVAECPTNEPGIAGSQGVILQRYNNFATGTHAYDPNSDYNLDVFGVITPGAGNTLEVKPHNYKMVQYNEVV
jgi:hypothetical protein